MLAERAVRIAIDVSVANSQEAHRWLDRILNKFEDGWHVWDMDREPNPEAFEATTWLRDVGRQGKRVSEMLVASIQRGAWTSTLHGRRVRVTMHPNGTDQLKPEDAARLADEQMVILVENRNSDGAFLKRVVAELDKPLHQHWHRWGYPIRLDSVGGIGEMPMEVNHRADRLPYRPRLIVIVDSDRKAPNDRESQSARSIRQTCETRGVACWVLAKRAAENYLPRILLSERQDAGADHGRTLEVWDRLNDDQKNFFDMKDGVPEEPSAIEEELFDGLSPADRELLSNGFGRNVYKCWTVWSVQAKSELRARGQGDLEHGIDLIRGEI